MGIYLFYVSTVICAVISVFMLCVPAYSLSDRSQRRVLRTLAWSAGALVVGFLLQWAGV